MTYIQIFRKRMPSDSGLYLKDLITSYIFCCRLLMARIVPNSLDW
jgi:hypothetical protein